MIQNASGQREVPFCTWEFAKTHTVPTKSVTVKHEYRVIDHSWLGAFTFKIEVFSNMGKRKFARLDVWARAQIAILGKEGLKPKHIRKKVKKKEYEIEQKRNGIGPEEHAVKYTRQPS